MSDLLAKTTKLIGWAHLSGRRGMSTQRWTWVPHVNDSVSPFFIFHFYFYLHFPMGISSDRFWTCPLSPGQNQLCHGGSPYRYAGVGGRSGATAHVAPFKVGLARRGGPSALRHNDIAAVTILPPATVMRPRARAPGGGAGGSWGAAAARPPLHGAPAG